MLAELDDASAPKDCLEIARSISGAGNSKVKSKIYAGAHHAWEALGKVHYEKDSLLYRVIVTHSQCTQATAVNSTSEKNLSSYAATSQDPLSPKTAFQLQPMVTSS